MNSVQNSIHNHLEYACMYTVCSKNICIVFYMCTGLQVLDAHLLLCTSRLPTANLIELSTLLLYYRHEYNLLHIPHHHQVSDYVNYSIIAANYLMNAS